MNNDQKREHVIAMYPGPGWRKKVEKMSDGQVFAIYTKHQEKLRQEMRDAKAPKTEDPSDNIPF